MKNKQMTDTSTHSTKPRIQLKSLFLAATCMTLLSAGSALAETSLTLGLGAAYAPDYVGSDDYEFGAFPAAELTWETDETTNPDGQNTVSIGLHGAGLSTMDGIYIEMLRVNFGNHMITQTVGVGMGNGREEGDNKALKGLGDIDDYAIGNISLSYGPAHPENATFVTAGLDASFDMSSETDGITIGANVMLNHMIGDKLLLSFGPNVTWTNDDHAQSYFGITNTQAARSVYTRYDADGGLQDAGYSISARYTMTDNIGLFAIGQYSRLLGDAADSPIVAKEGSENQLSVSLGMAYSF